MLNSTVLNLLGWAISCLTVLIFVTCIGAIGLGEWAQAGTFFVSGCISGFIAGALIIGFGGRVERLSRLHVSVLLVAVWLVLPVVASLPFYVSGDFDGLDLAFFEAVSGLTTTGATVIVDLAQVPKAIIFWRALLQWFGGALTLLTAVLVLAPFGVLSTPINITIPGYERDDLAKSILATGRHLMPTYSLLTLVCMILLWLSGIPGFDALCLALSTISTGGFMPTTGNISQYDSGFAEVVLLVFMLLGATSFLAHRATLLRVPGTHVDNYESWYLAVVAAISGVILVLLLALSYGPDGSWGVIWVGMFRAVSLITTSGFDNAGAVGVSVGVPFAVVLALCSIGGASFSTAGGLKVFRVFSMTTQAHRELKRLVHPRGITKAVSAGKAIDIQIMKTIWSMFFVFLIATGVVSVVLGAEGVPVGRAVIAAMSSLTNTGPALQMTAYDVAGPTGAGLYAQLTTFPLLVLSGAMILGRIEFVVLLSLGLHLVTRR